MKKKSKRTWWAVAAVYNCNHPNEKSLHLSRRLSERCIYLVHARTRDKAQKLGQEIAESREHQYRAIGNNLISWKLKTVEPVISLYAKKIGHGAEVYNDWIVDKKRHRRPLIV